MPRLPSDVQRVCTAGYPAGSAHKIQRMDTAVLARFTALCRAGIGCAFIVAPELSMRPWIGREAGRPRTRLLVRALGTRDVVIAAGTLASPEAQARRSWLSAALVADLADLLLTIAGRKRLPQTGATFVLVVAGAGVAMGAAALAGTAR